MAIESVKARLAPIPDGLTKQELYILLTALVDALQAITAKLDADTGVADTNYAATFATYIVD
jgi:hypothetical protein